MHTERSIAMDVNESLKPLKTGVRIPCRMHPDLPMADTLRGAEVVSRSGVSHATEQKESCSENGHLTRDHTHMLVPIPPKCAASRAVGFIKGKRAIRLARVHGKEIRAFARQQFRAGGYLVSTFGRDEDPIRNCIRRREKEDREPDPIKPREK